eukprot:TRINITY_DN1017_c0_g1_i1.p1 TRINITY_DN1017_c0_g1~~TRINITY_DN1017_c0_g1_i1.p1  ORF type:complete len:470 (-),score=47.93 TRINITY_DN1017_c0_g1_i1:55-1464(-)
MKHTLNIVSVGCLHGELNLLYESIGRIEKKSGARIDLVLVNGDFQSVRSKSDLEALACPPKYRKMGDFEQYYSGKRKAPYLTILIGGNHEASHYLAELYYGGWVAENIYYLGKCGVVNVNGFRIAGISGIFKPGTYRKGYHEVVPLDEDDKRTIYHVREYEVLKMSLIQGKIDIMMSHDWPFGVAECGDLKSLLARKPHFEEQINQGILGNPGTGYLLHKLKPQPIIYSLPNNRAIWLAAHLHVHYTATVRHSSEVKTEFLALDKPLPKRMWFKAFTLEKEENCTPVMQYIVAKDAEFEAKKRKIEEEVEFKLKAAEEEKKLAPYKETHKSPRICYDLEWLAITNVVDPLMSLKIHVNYFNLLRTDPNYAKYCPFKGKPINWDVSIPELQKYKEEERKRLSEVIKNTEVLPIDVKDYTKSGYNPQTKKFMELIGIDSKLYPTEKEKPAGPIEEIDILEFCQQILPNICN